MIEKVYIVLTLAALLCASIDAWLIALNKPIAHGIRLAVRVVFALGYIVALASMGAGWQPRLVPIAIGGGAVFVCVFRFALNALRGKLPIYISTSNVYDRMWMTLAYSMGKHNHGGFIAYIVESAIALAVATTYTLA